MNIALSSADANGTVTATNRGDDKAEGLSVEIDGAGASRLADDSFDLSVGETVQVLTLPDDGPARRITVDVRHGEDVVASKVYPVPFSMDHD